MRELLKNNAGVLLGFLGLIVLTLISPKTLKILLLMNLLAIIFHLLGQFRLRSRIGRQSRKGKIAGHQMFRYMCPVIMSRLLW